MAGVLDDRVLELSSDDEGPTYYAFSGCVADHPDGRRLVVRRGAVVFLDLRASAHRPVLQTLFPTAETRIVDRARPDVFRWSVSDEDGPDFFGGERMYSIHYALSYDGEHWIDQAEWDVPLGVSGLVEQPIDQAIITSEGDVDFPHHGLQHVWLETGVSDGFWTVHNVVGPFRIHNCEPPLGFPPHADPCDRGDLARFRASVQPAAHQ
jgi:hypothetical protein